MILWGSGDGCLSSSSGAVTGSGIACGGSSPLTTKGDIFVFSSTNDRLPVGANGTVLSSDSTQPTGLKWITAFTNPMTTLGDIVYGGAAGAVTRLPGSISASTLCLTQTGTGSISAAPIWGSCAGTAATALSSVSAATTSNTIASGNNPITWNWQQTTNTQTAFTFGETSASTGTNDHIVDIKTVAGSSAIPLTVSDSLTGSQAFAALQILPTWNTSGVVDAALLVNVTNTASGAASKLLDLQVGGVSQMAVDKAGIITNATWNGVPIAASSLSGTTLAASVVTSSLTTVGTIGTGTWAGTTIAVNHGGTGATTLTGVLKGNGTSAFTIAASADIRAMWSGTCDNTTFFRGDGVCAVVGSGGSVTAVTATSPIVSSGGSTPNISIPVATTSVNGYLSSTDWTTFNSKQAALGYTPAHSGANSDITSLSGLTTALSPNQGGTGNPGTGYAFGHGASNFTYSTTIPGASVTGAIPGTASNLTAAILLPTGTTAHTDAINSNNTDIATTAYVANPGVINPVGIVMTGAGPSTVQMGGVTFCNFE